MALQAILGLPKSSNRLTVTDWDKEDDLETAVNMANQVQLPPFDARHLSQLTSENGLKMNFYHGTTTLGFKYRGGVIIAVDSRATGGSYIASGKVVKILEIDRHLVGTMAGGAADCQYWNRVLAMKCRLFQLRNSENISVAAASKLLSNICFNYKGMGLSMGVMVAGYDKKGTGLYYVDDDGRRVEGSVFSVGSGSVYAYSILDKDYRDDLTDEEAFELGRRAIYHATVRDSASGGIIRVAHIGPNGFRMISEEDCMDIHDRLKNTP